MSAYKRILEIELTDVERMTVSARVFGLTIRKAAGPHQDEYVIESDDPSDRVAIDRIVRGYEAALEARRPSPEGEANG